MIISMRAVGSVALLLAAAGAALAQAPATESSIYTCVDATGRRLSSDRPIVSCIDREQRELGPTGHVRRSIGPTLTDLERAAQAEQKRREIEVRMRMEEELRRDRSLVERYPSASLHNIERENALRPVDDSIEASYKRIGELENRRNAINAELAFHKPDPSMAPETLKRQASDNAEMIQAQRRFIADRNQEKTRINVRFDSELARLRQLWGPAPATPTALKPASASASR